MSVSPEWAGWVAGLPRMPVHLVGFDSQLPSVFYLTVLFLLHMLFVELGQAQFVAASIRAQTRVGSEGGIPR